MGQPGIGVMLGYLGGNESSVDAFKKALNKIIKTVKLENDELQFEFEDGYKMALADEGQSCCEHRYMVTDDDLEYYNGAELLDAELKDAPNEADEYGEHEEQFHEVQFLEIKTSKGVFTMASHNEHNGYYGGFLIRAKEL